MFWIYVFKLPILKNYLKILLKVPVNKGVRLIFIFTLFSDWLSEVLVGLKEQYRSFIKSNSGQDSFVELSTDNDGLIEFFKKNQGKVL